MLRCFLRRFLTASDAKWCCCTTFSLNRGLSGCKGESGKYYEHRHHLEYEPYVIRFYGPSQQARDLRSIILTKAVLPAMTNPRSVPAGRSVACFPNPDLS